MLLKSIKIEKIPILFQEMDRTKKTVFVSRGDETRFFSSLERLNEFFSTCFTPGDFEICDNDGRYEKIIPGYSLPDDIRDNCYEIMEFEFESNEPVTFMECNGPSSECCSFEKKTSFEFYHEMAVYMELTYHNSGEIDDCISSKNIDNEQCKCVRYAYCNGEEDDSGYGLTTFYFYSRIQLI